MRSKTVLDHVRPTVVVRRRICNPSSFGELAPSAPSESDESASDAAATRPPRLLDETRSPRAHALLPTQSWGSAEDDENGPPSSINVARALAALRSDELQRLDEILRARDHDDDEFSDEAGGAAPSTRARVAEEDEAPPRSLALIPASPALPELRLEKEIALTELASRMDVPVGELITALVTHGFFTVGPATTLTREVASAGAEMFGWRVEAMSEAEEAEAARSRGRVARGSKAKRANGTPDRSGPAGGRSKRVTGRGT